MSHTARDGFHADVGRGVDAVTAPLLGGIAGGIGGLQQRRRAGPVFIDGGQTNACPNAKTLFFMGEAVRVHLIADALRDAPGLIGGAVFSG